MVGLVSARRPLCVCVRARLCVGVCARMSFSVCVHLYLCMCLYLGLGLGLCVRACVRACRYTRSRSLGNLFSNQITHLYCQNRRRMHITYKADEFLLRGSSWLGEPRMDSPPPPPPLHAKPHSIHTQNYPPTDSPTYMGWMAVCISGRCSGHAPNLRRRLPDLSDDL